MNTKTEIELSQYINNIVDTMPASFQEAVYNSKYPPKGDASCLE